MISPFVHDDFAKETTICLATLTQLLIEKGIVTEQEFNAAKCRVTAEFDQQFVAHTEEFERCTGIVSNVRPIH